MSASKETVREEFEEYMKRRYGVTDSIYQSEWADWQAAYQRGFEAALEQAAQLAEYHHANHADNRDDSYRNCGTAIATGIRNLKGSRFPPRPLSRSPMLS